MLEAAEAEEESNNKAETSVALDPRKSDGEGIVNEWHADALGKECGKE